ncbi:MAG TPA: phosphoribosylamine--glycine ligase, partial [Candidatus Glassbacteria bacterium]|nr:phosphoribosylamine--glycine ligase [Candidatus Glassbacteria bacterium]
MKVLVVGNGGREHALLWRLASDSPGADFFITRGSPGTAPLARSLDVSPTDVGAVADAVDSLGINLTVVGPEVPLAAGLADRLIAGKRMVFGPAARAAQIESSKVFAKELMRSIGVPTAAFEVFRDRQPAADFINAGPRGCVVKADGLAAGKGAIVCRRREDALAAVEKIMGERAFGRAGDAVVVEELMVGEEL